MPERTLLSGKFTWCFRHIFISLPFGFCVSFSCHFRVLAHSFRMGLRLCWAWRSGVLALLLPIKLYLASTIFISAFSLYLAALLSLSLSLGLVPNFFATFYHQSGDEAAGIKEYRNGCALRSRHLMIAKRRTPKVFILPFIRKKEGEKSRFHFRVKINGWILYALLFFFFFETSIASEWSVCWAPNDISSSRTTMGLRFCRENALWFWRGFRSSFRVSYGVVRCLRRTTTICSVRCGMIWSVNREHSPSSMFARNFIRSWAKWFY